MEWMNEWMKSHPCWIHASGHKWMPTVTHCVDSMKLFAEWDLDICLGCDLATQLTKLRQHMSDTNIAVTSLGTSGPSTLQSDLPVSDYHLSEPLKQHVGGCWFQNK
jgi:hypothetical protein